MHVYRYLEARRDATSVLAIFEIASFSEYDSVGSSNESETRLDLIRLTNGVAPNVEKLIAYTV